MHIPPEALAVMTAIVGGLVSALVHVYLEKGKVHAEKDEIHKRLEAALVRLDSEVKARLEAAERRADEATEIVRATETISSRLEAAIGAITSQPEVRAQVRPRRPLPSVPER
jgi:hypothetical protein